MRKDGQIEAPIPYNYNDDSKGSKDPNVSTPRDDNIEKLLDDDNSKKRIERLMSVIEQGWKSGKAPLFLFGAYGSPIEIDQYKHAKETIEKMKKNDKAKEISQSDMYELVKKNRTEGVPLSRPLQTVFFSELKGNSTIWNEYCKGFLREWIEKMRLLLDYDSVSTTNEKKEMIEDAAGMYQWIFENLTNVTNSGQNILLMTTNFDGALPQYLTHKSREQNEQKKQKGCPPHYFELNNTKTIANLPLHRIETDQDIRRWLITLRGDVYHVICNNPMCSNQGKEISVYESFNCVKENSKGESAVIVELLLKCPECGSTRTVTLSFPGYYIKDQEINELMAATWESFGTRISCIITVGFSGNSDSVIVDYLVKFAEQLEIPWFHWKKKKDIEDGAPPAPLFDPAAVTAVQSAGEIRLSNRLFYLITSKNGAEDINDSFKYVNSIQNERINPENNSTEEKRPEVKLPPDYLWVLPEEGDTLINLTENLCGKKRKDIRASIKTRIKRAFNADISELSSYISNVNREGIAISIIHQLALQDYWWDPLDRENHHSTHSRLNHSLGVMRIANAWFTALKPEEKGSNTALPIDYKHLEELLNFTALLHDIGHSPFSHLIERVFNELHWTFNGEEFHHELLTRIKLYSMSKSKKSKKLFNSLEKRNSNYLESIFQLLDGVSGINWLDAIMNSPFDADKIDYIFRDMEWMGLTGRQGQRIQWLKEFLKDQEIAQEGGQILLNGKSAVVAYRLLSERSHLYNMIYHSPRMRVMERMVQYVLCNYFILKYSNTVVNRINELMGEKLKSKNTADNDDPAELVVITNSIKYNAKNSNSQLFRLIPFLQQCIEYLTYKKRSDEDSSEPTLFLNDYGTYKLACSLADISYIIESGYPLTRKRLIELSKQSAREEYASEDNDGIDSFLKRREYDALLAEVKILIEIALWAKMQSSKKHGDKKTRDIRIYQDICDTCCLLIDPAYSGNEGGESSTNFDDESVLNNGQWLDKVLSEHCIAGPYILRAPKHKITIHEAEIWLKQHASIITEIGREISAQYPGKLLIDVVGPFKIRSYPSKRVLKMNDERVVSEMFYVPEGDPATWSIESKATVPLYKVDFRSNIPSAYKLRIMLIDPTKNKIGQSNIKDRFKRICKQKGIVLKEEHDG
ncbi:MAG: HD domain-containing protein [Candidatus Cloacimonetes bacterium]|nr:HD domain-containing protein [Candidatus Cloacimonadota bacterium]